MQRYPTSQGLALPITELGYEVMSESVKRTQGHHLYFEREWYNRPMRLIFRNLVGHVVRMRPADHEELHDRFGPPAMLRDYQMIGHIDDLMTDEGLLVHKERKLRETWHLTPDRWEREKNGRTY